MTVTHCANAKELKVNHDQVCHVWANQSKPNAKGFAIFFDGPTVYSYGHHFPIATHVKNSRGQAAVIFTRDSYGVTTAKHITQVHRALHGLNIPTFYGKPVPGWSTPANDKAALRESFKQYVKDAKEQAIKAKRARLYGAYHVERAQELLDQGAALNAFFKLGMKLPAGELVTDEELRAMKAKQAAANKVRREREAAREAEQRKADSERFEAWKNGEGHACPWSYSTDEEGSAYLRITGEEVQTSRGAQVPLEHAKRAFRFVKLCREQGREWHRNGSQVRVGYFSLESVDAAGNVRIGCHYITWSHVAGCAKAGGFFEESASSEAVEKTAA
jgi:hypothetical protein